ncbi:hypothetical protein ABBQ38_000109 [Trebouxia sp. C0009 RCD-2024]
MACGTIFSTVTDAVRSLSRLEASRTLFPMAEASQASGQQALYPPPPAFYRLYRQDAGGTAERPLPPEPPAPAQADYQLFGEMHTVEPGIPPLQAARLYHTKQDGCVDTKQELLQMNRELLFIFRELISALIDQPSSWSQRCTDISSMLRQMQHLLNALRPHQASVTLANSLQAETQQRNLAVADLKAQTATAQAWLQSHSSSRNNVQDPSELRQLHTMMS